MKVILDYSDIEVLFENTNCVIIPYWEGGAVTINKTDDGMYYMVRWEEYEPCTDKVDLKTLVDVTLSEGVVLYETDYNKLYCQLTLKHLTTY